jgi:hypothetical protein
MKQAPNGSEKLRPYYADVSSYGERTAGASEVVCMPTDRATPIRRCRLECAPVGIEKSTSPVERVKNWIDRCVRRFL